MVRNGDNVIPLYLGREIADGDLPVPVEELAEVVGAIGRCLDEIGSEPEPRAIGGKVTATPLLLHMTTVEQQLEKLTEITVTTWPDVRWALHFCNARVRALGCIRASAAWFQTARSYSEPLRAWEEDSAFVEFGAVRRALRDVRDLIVDRYPQTRPTCY